ncbi:MAG: hypothetical protein OEM02_12315 [Desulfobulbaceae bacterium]|nr:hypothetical protein [Desulfobulbaceae bacterium]
MAITGPDTPPDPPLPFDPSEWADWPLDSVIAYIFDLLVHPKVKKYLFIEWAKITNFNYSGYHIALVTGLPPGTL